MALCAAHREERAALQLERLSTHQMYDVRADFMYLPTAPLFHGIFVQSIKVFMISVYEQDRKRQGFQPVKLRIVAFIAVPHKPCVAADDHVVILRHLGLFWKVLRLKPKRISVKIAGCVNHHVISL